MASINTNLLFRKAYLLLILFCVSLFVNSQDDFQNKTTDEVSSFCGSEVLNYLKTNYFHDANVNIEISGYEISLAKMLDWSKKLNPYARAVDIKGVDFKEIPIPCILHFSTKHYIVLLGYTNESYDIFDPAAKHIKKTNLSYLKLFSSNKAIVFSSSSSLAALSDIETKNTKGSFSHEFPPPNETEDGKKRGRKKKNRAQGECRNKRGGSPLISFNPEILNVVVEDVPMWYDAGVGPDFTFDLVFNSNDKQELTGDAISPTQYFPLGKRWSFSYATFYHEVAANEITLILGDGARESYTFSSDTAVPDNSDNYDIFERYAIAEDYGYCLTVRKSKLKYRYDDPLHNKLTSIEDRNGNIATINYNADYNIQSVTDANGQSVVFVLDGNGRVTQATDPLGRTAKFQYGYTNNDFLVEITDMADFTSTLNYDMVPIVSQSGSNLQAQIVAITTPAGTSEIEYTATGVIGPNQLAFYWTFTNPNGVRSSSYFSYGAATTGILKMYDNNGNFDEYYLDLPNYRISHIIRANPSETVFYGYDASGNTNIIITGGFEEQFVYDQYGNVIHYTDPRGKITLFSFDENDNLKTVNDPLDRLTVFEYDAFSNVTSISTPVNDVQYSYYPNGNLNTTTDGNNNVVTYAYDGLDFLTGISYPIGKPTTITNDVVGRVISFTDEGLTTTYDYDDLDQTTLISFPDGTNERYVYDFRNLIERTDKGNRKSTFTYDGMNQPVSVVFPQGKLSLIRDNNGNVTQLSVNGQKTSFTYDEMNRLIIESNLDGSTKQYIYNELGNIFTRTDENGILTTYTYDYNLLTNIDYGDNTPDVSFGYNDNGETIQMTDGTGFTTFHYDDGGRLINVTGPAQGDDFTYTYDGVSNIKSMSIDGLSVDYTYDELSRLTDVVSGYISASYTYDDKSNLINTQFDNGTYTNYSYDAVNRLSSLYQKKSSGEVISGFNYTFDEFALLERIKDYNGVISKYDYDYAYRLVSENVLNQEGKTLWYNKYSYDNLGNRITVNKNGTLDQYSFNMLNQLTRLITTNINVSGIIYGDSASTVYVEDVRANTTYLGANQLAFEATDIPLESNQENIQLYARVNETLATVDDSSKFICSSKTLADGSINIYLFDDLENVGAENINTIVISKDTINYSYDDNGNLIQRINSAGTTDYLYDAENRLVRIDLPGGDYEEYQYDGFGQRVAVLKNGTVHNTYVYDNLFEAVAIKDNADNSQYIIRGLGFAGGVGGIIGIHDSGNGNITNYFNHHGDLINATASDESVLLLNEFDAFGNIKSSAGIQNSDYGYSSKEHNDESGLYYFGGRYYSPEQNQWLSKDPLGFDAGYNMYAFVSNNPVMYIDPFGYQEDNEVIKRELKLIEKYLKKTGTKITKKSITSAIKNLAKTGKLAPNFSGRLGAWSKAGGTVTGVLQTFLSPEGVEGMRGAIQMAEGLNRENEMVRKNNLLGCGNRIRPGQKRIGQAARDLNSGLKGIPLIGWLFKTPNDE